MALDLYKPLENIINAADYRNRRERKLLRLRLNSSPDIAIFNGNDFAYSNENDGSNGRWGRREVRRLTRNARQNLNNAYQKREHNNFMGYEDLNLDTEYPSDYNLQLMVRDARNLIFDLRAKGLKSYTINYGGYDNKPSDKYKYLPFWLNNNNLKTNYVFEEPDYFDSDYFKDKVLFPKWENKYYDMFNNINLLKPKFQQGGSLSLTSELDQEEKIILRSILGYIGANPDSTAEESLKTVVTAYMQDPESLQDIATNDELVQKGLAIMKQKEPETLQQLSKPGMIKNIITEFSKQVQSARMGAKLNYIKELKNICPEGYELRYMAKGGHMCPICKKKAEVVQKETKVVEKACGGTKAMAKIKEAMKCGGKMKKKENGGEMTDDKKNKEIVYTPAKRDSLINEFNKNPKIETLKLIQTANRLLAEWDDLNPDKGVKINLELVKKLTQK